MIKSQKIFSPQKYLDAMTGYCYILHDKYDVVNEIHSILKKHKIETTDRKIADFPFEDIKQVVASNVDVVLVDISWYGPDDVWENKYRWFEVTEDFNERKKN